MKKILIIIGMLIISNFSYYGKVDENGEKVIELQGNTAQSNLEIENEIVEQQNIEQVQKETEIQKIENSKTKEQQNITKIQQEENNIENTTKQNNAKKNTTKQDDSKQNTTKNSEISNTKQNTKVQNVVEESKIETKKDSTQEQNDMNKKQSNCSKENHDIAVGNTKKWFLTKQEAISYYDKEVKYWGDWWATTKSEEDNEKYRKNCPIGYEIWSCPYCSKWTINFYYNK